MSVLKDLKEMARRAFLSVEKRRVEDFAVNENENYTRDYLDMGFEALMEANPDAQKILNAKLEAVDKAKRKEEKNG